MESKPIATNFSIFAALRDQLNPSFCIQITIILFGLWSAIDFGVDVLPLTVRIIGLFLFILQLLINYNMWKWVIGPADHPLLIPHRTNWTTWFMLHFAMPVAIGNWPQMVFHRITARFRNTSIGDNQQDIIIEYPSLIFWGSVRCGTTTFAHHLMHLDHEDFKFVGPLSVATVPSAYKKESNYFVSAFGCNSDYQRYSMSYPMSCCGSGCGSKRTIYFDGYPEFHSFPHIRDRLFAINPSFKFLVFLRDPCSKVISHYCQMQSVYSQVTGKGSSYFTKQMLDEQFKNMLDNIHSERYQSLYQFFCDLKVDDTPPELKRNIAEWTVDCGFGRAMFGRDLKYWYQKFDDPHQWLILDMKSILKDERAVKNAVMEICTFAGAELGSEFMDNWIPTELRLNQNTIKYVPREEDRKRLEKFYEKDQQQLYAFIKEKGLRFVHDAEEPSLSYSIEIQDTIGCILR